MDEELKKRDWSTMSHLTHIQQIGNMTCVTHNKAINKKIKKKLLKKIQGAVTFTTTDK